jgi:hypothetical protein
MNLPFGLSASSLGSVFSGLSGFIILNQATNISFKKNIQITVSFQPNNAFFMAVSDNGFQYLSYSFFALTGSGDCTFC